MVVMKPHEVIANLEPTLASSTAATHEKIIDQAENI